MRDFQLNFFFYLGSHMDSHGIARRQDTATYTAVGREQTSPREIDTDRENNPFQILSSQLYRT
jgi:hypothetical protein